MSKAQHTPGPWYVAANEIRNEDHGVIVARIPEWGIASDLPDQREANARLIAAAPDLLEALEVFVNKYDSAPDGILGVGLVNGDFTKARAAIAKAKGE